VHAEASLIVHTPALPQQASGCGHVLGEHEDPSVPEVPAQLVGVDSAHTPLERQHATAQTAAGVQDVAEPPN